MNGTLQNRPRIKDFLEHTWFNDPKLMAMRFIKNLENNDSFFKPKIIDIRFLPALMNALKVETLIVSALPAMFCICESQNMKIDFEQAVWPGLKHLFQMKQVTAAELFYIISCLN